MILFIFTTFVIFSMVFVELPESCTVPWTWSDESIPKNMSYSERGTKQLNSLELRFIKSIEEALRNMNVTEIDFDKLWSTTPYIRSKKTSTVRATLFIKSKPKKFKRIMLTETAPRRRLLDLIELGNRPRNISKKVKCVDELSETSEESESTNIILEPITTWIDKTTTPEPTTCTSLNFTFRQANAWFRKITGKSLLKDTWKNKSLTDGIMKLIKTRPPIKKGKRHRGSFDDYSAFIKRQRGSVEDEDGDEKEESRETSLSSEFKDELESDFQTGSESESKNARARKRLFESYDLLHPRKRRNVHPFFARSLDAMDFLRDDSFIFPWLTSIEVKTVYGTTLDGEKYHVCLPWEIDKVGKEDEKEIPDVSNPEWRQWLRIQKQKSIEQHCRENGTFLSTSSHIKLKSWENFLFNRIDKRPRWPRRKRKRTTPKKIWTHFNKKWTGCTERTKRRKRTAEFPSESAEPENQAPENEFHEPEASRDSMPESLMGVGPRDSMPKSLMGVGPRDSMPKSQIVDDPPQEHPEMENPAPERREHQTWAVRSWTRKRSPVQKDESQEVVPLEGPEGPEGPDRPDGPEGPEGSYGPEGPGRPDRPKGPDASEGPDGPDGPDGQQNPWENNKPHVPFWTRKKSKQERDENPIHNMPEDYPGEGPMPKDSANNRPPYENGPPEGPPSRSWTKKKIPLKPNEKEGNEDYYPIDYKSQTWPSRTWSRRTWPSRTWSWPSRTWGSHTWGGRTWPSRTWSSPSRTWESFSWGARTWPSRTWAARAYGDHTWPSRTWGDRTWPSRIWDDRQWPSKTWASRIWGDRTWPSRSWGDRQWPSRTWANRAWGDRTWPSRTWGDRPWTGRSWSKKPYGNWPPRTTPSDSQLRSDEKDAYYEEVRRDPPAKRPAPASSKKEASGGGEDDGWHLGNNRFVKVREFRGKVMVDIREFYEKNGEMLPGKKGIALSATQWKKFRDYVNEIDDRLSQVA